MVAILAFGSLIDTPGSEIDSVTADRRRTLTPFSVEFARFSRKRRGAATLVPVDRDGAPVKAALLILDQAVSIQEAKNMLWRRETGSTAGAYREVRAPGPDTVLVKKLEGFDDLDVVLYVDFPPEGKVRNPEPDQLADRAIASATGHRDKEDGITYLLRAKYNGIATPLMTSYERRILEKTGASNLAEALEKARSSR